MVVQTEKDFINNMILLKVTIRQYNWVNPVKLFKLSNSDENRK